MPKESFAVVFLVELAWLSFTGLPCCVGAEYFAECQKRLVDDDVFDFFMIRDMAFITRVSAVVAEKDPVKDISHVVDPATAVKNGLPSRDAKRFIDSLVAAELEMELTSACLINNGQHGFTWKVGWDLYPDEGFFSGPPYKYHAVVSASGQSVLPEAYLCDDGRARLRDDSDDRLFLFSVLAVDDLLPPAKTPVEERRILVAATEAFNRAVADCDLGETFHPLAPRRITVPGTLASVPAHSAELEAWAVRFVSSAITDPKDSDYGASIVIWVTSDLKTSTVTLGEWRAERLRLPK